MFHKDIVTELIHHAQIHLVRMLIDCPDTDKSQKVTETNGFADFIEKEVFPLSSSCGGLLMEIFRWEPAVGI